MTICPCQYDPHQTSADSLLAQTYATCCQPFHKHTALPDTAEQLMRSRYSAFYLHKVDYIIATTLPAQQVFLNSDDLLRFARSTDWQGLTVEKHLAKLGKRHAQVEFKAYFDTPNGLEAHHELSTFVKATHRKTQTATTKGSHKKPEKWYFLDPTLHINIPQKQPCLCGSGEKFKRCCGQYLP